MTESKSTIPVTTASANNDYLDTLSRAQDQYDRGNLEDAYQMLLFSAQLMDGHPEQGRVREWARNLETTIKKKTAIAAPRKRADLATLRPRGSA